MANEVAVKKKNTDKAEAKKQKEAGKNAKRNEARKTKGRRGPIRYIKDVINELKKVTWPTRKELLKAVLAVLAFVAAFTLVIWLMDLALTPVFRWLVG